MLPSPADVQEYLARITASSSFSNSERLRELLRYTVMEALEGRGASLKESVLGVTVFGRKPGYDSDANSIVRVEFARLRKKLEQYYEGEGAGENWRILFPKGSYAPEFVRTEPGAAPVFVRSVVVLPFTCPGSDPDDEYFVDGLTDELITALTRVPGLKVVARTSSFTFKGRAGDIRGIGARLQVDTGIEGSLRRQGDLLRIHVQVVNTRDACYLWAGKYERHLTGVFQLQEEIAADIVAALKMELPRPGSVSPRTASPEAHALYLKGRFWWHRWNPGALSKAATFFQQAIESDPTFARAYAGFADCLSLQGYYGYGRPRDIMPRAKAYATKALEIDPMLPEAYCSLALLANYWEWDTREYGRLLRRCLELNPSHATAVAKYATYLSLLDRYEEASDWLSRALVLDPLSASMHADLAIISAMRGLDELFEREAARVLEMDSAMVKLYWWQMKTRGARKNWLGAVEAAECALRHMPEDPVTLGFAAAAYAGFGNADRAAALQRKLESLSQVRYVPYAACAYAHDEKGGEEAFFRLMKQAVEERDAGARVLRIMRRFTQFASDPRYDALLKKVGLSDQDVAQAAAVHLAGYALGQFR
jgi:TolB-like protein/tetratricopeptide (TPR) repeat protein